MAVISFGEATPEHALHRAMAAAVDCVFLVAAGVSLVGYPTAALPRLALDTGARLVICSRDPTRQDSIAGLVIQTPVPATFAPLEHKTFD